ncbi:MAG: long-chain fatty acid--CoA ligase [Sandarakinorhabdus sp.]|nr:long-chain fatty acid--CoA ligase [Sandarakinorhabdus sp.]
MAPSTLAALCTEALGWPAGRQALEWQGGWIGWGRLAAIARQVQQALEASHAPRHAPVALVSRNRPETVAALLALVAMGRSIRMIHPFQSSAGMATDLATARPGALLAAAADIDGPVRDSIDALGIAAIALAPDGATVVAPGGWRGPPPPAPDGGPDIQILTSGTTGPPKHFAMTHRMIAEQLVLPALSDGAGTDWEQAPPVVLYFPLGNISGIYATLPALLKGQRAVLLDRFSLDAWLDYIERHRPSSSGIPTSAMRALLDADVAPERLSSLRAMGMGAAPLDPALHRAFEARYGIPILLSYGATEFAGPVTAMTAALHAEHGAARFGSVGRALPGVQLRIVDPSSGAQLPPGSEGLLEVVAPRIGPHWIRTSDLAVLDADGFLFHRGRADGAILRGGFKLLPETIESALAAHPDVAEAMVVPVPDDRLGQVPAALVVPRPGADPGADLLAIHLRHLLPATHLPVHWLMVAQLPLNASHKRDRRAAAALFAQG